MNEYHPDLLANRILADARRLLIEESAWVKGPLAKDAKGRVTDPHSPLACSWCALGAIECVTSGIYDEIDDDIDDGGENVELAHELAIDRLGFEVKGYYSDFGSENEVAKFNDSEETEHSEILQLFDDALCRQDAERYWK